MDSGPLTVWESSWWLLLIGLAALGGLAGIIWAVRSGKLGGGGDFEIRLGPGDRVEVRGKIPQSKWPGIRNFFRDQPGGVPQGRIIGEFSPAGTPRLRFSKSIEPGVRQRSRNFLIEHLR